MTRLSIRVAQRVLVAVALLYFSFAPSGVNAVNDDGITLESMLQQVEDTLRHVYSSTAAEHLPEISRVRLNLKVTVQEEVKGTVRILIFTWGEEIKHALVQSISLVWTPPEDLRSTKQKNFLRSLEISQVLASAIERTALAVSQSDFDDLPVDLSRVSASVRFWIKREKSGSLSFEIFEIGDADSQHAIQELVFEFGSP